MKRVVAGDDRPSASTAQYVELSVGPIWPFARGTSFASSVSLRSPSDSSASATSATSVVAVRLVSCDLR